MTVTWMKNLTAGLALADAIVGGSGSALAQKKVAGNQITKFDAPGAGMLAGQGTFPQQILNSGTIVGYYVDTMRWLMASYEASMATTPLSMCRELPVHKLTASMTKGQWLDGGLSRLPRRAACITAICAIRKAT